MLPLFFLLTFPSNHRLHHFLLTLTAILPGTRGCHTRIWVHPQLLVFNANTSSKGAASTWDCWVLLSWRDVMEVNFIWRVKASVSGTQEKVRLYRLMHDSKAMSQGLVYLKMRLAFICYVGIRFFGSTYRLIGLTQKITKCCERYIVHCKAKCSLATNPARLINARFGSPATAIL